ncbi:TolB family protein [Nocardia sp. NPDC056000]|uniref:TolB family protein n=1 Tax=Nocardia sp. NPDC056000 TaxID=3345674 RepID=UPI0035E234C4
MSNTDGTDSRQIIGQLPVAGAPALSADGAMLAYTLELPGPDRKTDIVVSSADGSNAKQLTHTGDSIGATYSPDGRRLAFNRLSPSSSGSSAFDIFVMDSDGSSERQLTHTGDSAAAAYSPDGSKIVFYRGSWDGKRSDIFVMNADGGNIRQITNTGDSGGAVFSPDGTKLAFMRHGNGSSYAVCVMDIDGGNVRQLIATVNKNISRVGWGALPA